MVLNYILEITIVAALSVVIYILANALPRVGDEAEAQPSRLFSKFGAWWKALPLQKLDAFFSSVLEKFLRKARVVILKIENAVSHGINKVRKNKNAGVPADKSETGLFDKK